MFYLRHFTMLAFKHFPVKGILFVLLTILLLISFGHRNKIKSYLFSKLPEESFDPYFYALISDNPDIMSINDRIGKLPGVISCESIDSKLLASELTDLLSFYDLDLEFDYDAIKVTFDRNLKSNGQDLVRKYLIKLVGSDRVIAGDIKRDDEFVEKRGFLVNFLKRWGEVLTITILSIFWIIFWAIFSASVRDYCYLLEQYSRRRLVLLKVTLSGIIFLAFISCLCLYLLAGFLHWHLGLLLLVIILINLLNGRKLIWQH